MADEKMQVRIVVSTPTKTVLDSAADFVLLRAREGEMGILPGHEPCAVALDYGLLRTFTGKQPQDRLMVMGGFATVENSCVTVLTSVAEPPDRIGQVLEEMERQRLENKEAELRSDLEMTRAENALRRTLVGMDISTYSIIRGKEEREESHG